MSRVMRVRGKVGGTKSVDDIKATLHAIAIAKREVEALTKKIEEDTKALYHLMKASGVAEVEDTLAVAEVYSPPGRGSTWIDPVKFRAAVPDDKEFYAAISVGVTAAKQVMGQKEIDAISIKTPGSKGEETVKITMRK